MTNDDGTMVNSLHMATTNSICGGKCEYKNISVRKRKKNSIEITLNENMNRERKREFLLNHLSQVVQND